MAELRLFLADDHTLMRQGLTKLLQEQPGWRVVGEAANGRDAVRDTLDCRPDVAIFDIAMPMLGGIEATRQVLRRQPATPILILSMHTDEPYVTQALDAGARGYLLKDAAGHELVEAV